MAQPSPEIRQRLAQLKAEAQIRSERYLQKQKAIQNSEKIAGAPVALPTDKKAKGGLVFEHDLLSHPNQSKMVGPERVIHDSPELKIMQAKQSRPKMKSYRYVSYQNNEPVGAIQFMTDGIKPKSAVIQNAYVKSDMQRQGIGSNLLARARQDFDLRHSDELSEAGKAFAAKTKARGGRVTHAHHLEIEERPL